MVLKVEMQSREAEPSNFHSSPLIQAEEDKKVVNLRHSCPITQSEGAKTFFTGVYYSLPLRIVSQEAEIVLRRSKREESEEL